MTTWVGYGRLLQAHSVTREARHVFNYALAANRLRLKCDGTRAETRLPLSVKRTRRFKSAGASVQSTTGSRSVRISVSNAGYTMFRGSVKSTGYPLHSPVSPSFPLPCVTVCHHISTGVYCVSAYTVGELVFGALNGIFYVRPRFPPRI